MLGLIDLNVSATPPPPPPPPLYLFYPRTGPETQYFGDPFEPWSGRAQWVEPID